MNTIGVVGTVWEDTYSHSSLTQEELFRRLPSACFQPMPLFGSSPQEAQNLQEGEQDREEEDGSDSPHRTQRITYGETNGVLYAGKKPLGTKAL